MDVFVEQVNDGVPPPVPARPPPVPERSRPPVLPPPPQSAPPPPPVVPRARPPPPPTPPRAAHQLQASKAQLSSSLNAQPPNSVTTDSTLEQRQSSKPPQDGEAQKNPPPRPQAPNSVKKLPETTLPDPPRKKSFKIPPPLQTQPPTDEEKLAHILLQNESINGSVGKISMRQDSNVSSDSFSQNSSPSYTTKSMETPLLAQCGKKSKHKYLSKDKRSKERRERCMGDSDEAVSALSSTAMDESNNALTKSHSTPASLQTIVRFHNGSNMSIHHRVSHTTS